MNRQERGEALEQQVDEAVADLERQLSLGFTQEFLEVISWYSQFHRFSVLNALLIKMQLPTARLCAGYRQWEKKGYQVRRGEKAIFIRAPMIGKYTDPDTGEVSEYIKGFVATPVFDISQLEGDVELPALRDQLSGDYTQWYLLAMLAIEATGILVVEDSLPRGINGMSTGGTIYIEKSLTDQDKFNTILHELGHEVLHHGDDRKDTTKQQRELEAEACAFVLSRIYGLDNPYSRDYILAFKGTVEGLRDSLSRIHQAVKTIVGWIGLEPVKPLKEAQAA